MKQKLFVAFLCAFLPAVVNVLLGVGLFGRFLLPVVIVIAFIVQFAWVFVVLTLLPGKPREDAPPPGPAPVPVVPAADETSAPEGAGKKGYELFRRVVRYMEEQKPYLDDKLDLESFSRAMFSNKVYVSKNINYFSGRNFRQFINWYRIQYALELIKSDPHLKMEEVAMLSGFHSTVSFNMAFRLFEGKTPTEWHEEYVDALRRR